MKIVADEAVPFVSRLFSSLGEVELFDGRDIAAASIKDADCLVVRSVTPVDRKLLAGSRIKCVASATSGADHVDLDYLHARDIPLFDAKGCNATAVAEYVLSCLFVLSDQYGLGLEDKTVGIIGCGNVGSRLRRFLQVIGPGIGMTTRVYDPLIKDENNLPVFQELDEVLSADIITLHVPLTTAGKYPTAQMVDRDFLSKLKEDAILINTARGGIVNEQDLIRFAGRNQASRLVLDVWDDEPHINYELFESATLATPHIAGYSLDAKMNATRVVYEQVCGLFNSPAQVDPAVFPPTGTTELKITGFDCDIEAIQMAALASYDVRSDCAALKGIKEVGADKQAAFFDSLRADYLSGHPYRREFSATRVVLADNPGAFATPPLARGDQGRARCAPCAPLYDKLSALGFEVKTPEQ